MSSKNAKEGKESSKQGSQQKQAGATKPPHQHRDPVAAPPPQAAAALPQSAAASSTPSATSAVVAYPTSYPQSMNLGAIKDQSLVAVVEEEKALREELNGLRGQIRKVNDEKDANLRKFTPLQDKFATEVNGAIDRLHERRSALLNQLDQLKIEQYAAQEARDGLRMMDYEAAPLAKAIVDLKAAVQQAKNEVAKLEKQRAASTSALPFKSGSDADAEIARLEEAIETARKENKQQTVIAALAKQKVAAERCKKDIFATYSMDDRIIAEQGQIASLSQTLESKQKEKDGSEAKRIQFREKLAKAGETRTMFDSIRSELEGVKKQLDDAISKRKTERPVNTAIDNISHLQTDLRKRREAIESRLGEIRKQLQYHHIRIDPTQRSELIGRSGATLAQLQVDFGVAINLDASKETGDVFFLGAQEDVLACADAIREILVVAQKNNQKSTIAFDSTLKRAFIGHGGSNIEKIQAASGANIKLLDSEIVLTGTVESIATAKALIDEFVFSNARGELAFDPALMDMVIGRGGATIRRIEKDSGATRVNVIREEHKIVFTGNQDTVVKAKALYEEFIIGLTKNVFTLKADDRMIRTVIGKGGKTVQEIQEQSGALVSTTGNDTITIRGSAEAVALARKLIEDVGRRDEIKVPIEGSMYAFLTTRPLVTEAPATNDDGIEVQGQQQEHSSPLESIKEATKCDQVVALRSESVVVLRGRRECVSQAKQILQKMLIQNRPHVVNVPFHDVYVATLTKRDGRDRACVLDRLRAKHPGVLSIDVNRSAPVRTVEITGTTDAVQAAADELQQLLLQYDKTTRKIQIYASKVPQLIGRQGKTITDLQKAHKADIVIDKSTGEVALFLGASHAADDEATTALLDAAVAAVQAAVATSSSPTA